MPKGEYKNIRLKNIHICKYIFKNFTKAFSDRALIVAIILVMEV